jgi:hypothetical protein
MPHYTACRVLVGFDDGRPAQEDDDADLQLGDGELLLSYWDDEGIVVLVGDEREPGEYELLARSRPRRGTLRRDDAHTFTGEWEQGDECGTVRVELPADDENGHEEE